MTLEAAGYVVEELLGFGGSGEVWRARDATTGETVALKRLRGRDDPAARDLLRREAALLASLAGPHVMPLRAVLSTPDGPVLVLDYAAGGSLAGLRATRPRLEPGEIVTLGVPLANALADLHSRGVVHGDLSPSNVLFSADGRPMLADLGVARLVGDVASSPEVGHEYADPAVLAGGTVTPASDSYALGALLVECLTGEPFCSSARDGLVHVAPSSVVAALTTAVSADPAQRPSMAELAAALRSLGPAQPIRLDLANRPGHGAPSAATAAVTPAPTAPPEVPAARHWTALRTAVGLLAVGGLVALAVLAGLLLARGSASEAVTATPLRSAAPVSWTTVLAELDAAREAALAAGDPDALAAVYAPGSPVLQLELDRLRALLDQRLVVRGLQIAVVNVVAVRAEPARAVLTVTDRRSAYDLLDATGRLVVRQPARGEQSWRVELVRLDHRWRIASVG